MPTAEERSASDAIVGSMLLVFGFGCIGLCIYHWSAASKRVKQRLQNAASKRLMKRGKEGDAFLYVTGVEALQQGDQVIIGKETLTIEGVGFAVTVSEGLAGEAKSGDAVVKVSELREAASASATGQQGALMKDVAQGDKELLVTSDLVAKKGERLKISAGEQEHTIKSVGKIVAVSPALKTAHAIGSKLRKAGEAEQIAESAAEDADKEETGAEETAAEETATEETADKAPAAAAAAAAAATVAEAAPETLLDPGPTKSD